MKKIKHEAILSDIRVAKKDMTDCHIEIFLNGLTKKAVASSRAAINRMSRVEEDRERELRA